MAGRQFVLIGFLLVSSTRPPGARARPASEHVDVSTQHTCMWQEAKLLPFESSNTGLGANIGRSSNAKTKLADYLITSDPTVFVFTNIISCWVENNNLDQIATPYTFTLMVIFFLQQRLILPSVCSLQNNLPPIMEGNWNVAYKEKNISHTKEKLSILLVEFFEYYTNFDYERDVISPYIGYPLNKDRFMNHRTLPKDFQLYKSNVERNVTTPIVTSSTIVVQDVFEHNNNMAARLGDAVVTEIRTALRRAYDKYLLNTDYEQFIKSILKPHYRELPNFINK